MIKTMEWIVFLSWLIPTMTILIGLSLIATIWIVKTIIDFIVDLIG